MKKSLPLLRVSNRMHSKLHVRYRNLNEIKKLKQKRNPTPDRPRLGITTDISKEGISFLASNRPKHGDILEMQMSLPLKKQVRRVQLRGIVRWSRPKAPDEFQGEAFSDYTYLCGTEFLKSKDLTDISWYIEYLEWIRH